MNPAPSPARSLPWKALAGSYATVWAYCTAVGTLALLTVGVTGPGQTTQRFARWPFLDMWIRWDAGWYEGIATWGYAASTTEQSAVAFFPLYPLLIRAAVFLGANPFLAGIALNVLFGFAAVVLFALWSRAVSKAAATDPVRAPWLLLCWPFAYYLCGAVYSDSLFLALVCGAFLCLERGQSARATLLGVLATATRPIAPALVVGLCLRQWELRRAEGRPFRAGDALPVFSGLGLVAYMAFLHLRFGDALAFARTQVGWRQTASLRTFLKLELLEWKWRDLGLPLLHAGLALLLLGLALTVVRRKLGWGYAAYTAIAVGMPLLSSRDFVGLGRYGLALFPALWALNEWLRERPRLRQAWFATSTVLLGWLVALFAVGRYVS